MHRSTEVIPPALLHSLKHYKTLHRQVILLTVLTEEVAHLDEKERFKVENLGQGMYRVKAILATWRSLTFQRSR